MSSNQAQQYDEIPYPGLPVMHSQPDRLETLARLRGMHPQPASQARILELGCASGENLLPLAERYPQATLLGIDISGNQIQVASEMARALGLTNVEFRQQDLLDFGVPDKFDYIIAHGVYSWVEEPVRDKLLAICQSHLAEQGVAYVSYKTYPGWHLHEMIRDLMLYDARRATQPAEKVARAKMVLAFLKDAHAGDRPLDLLLRDEIEKLSRQSDSYLWHDHLAPVSHPVLFKQFITHAKSHSLQAVGDVMLGIRPMDFIDNETERHLAQLSTDPIQQEQFRDVLRHRAMRMAVLCHAELPLTLATGSDMIGELFLSAPLKPEIVPVDLHSTEVTHFVTPDGTRLGTPLPLAKAALLKLSEAWPNAIAGSELISAACAQAESAGILTAGPDEIQRLRDNLMQCALSGVVRLHSSPSDHLGHVTERPLASPLARLQSPRTEILSNRRHEPVRFDSFDRHVLSLLDGTRDQQQLVAELESAVQAKELVVLNRQNEQPGPEEIHRALEEALPAALQRLAGSALLIG